VRRGPEVGREQEPAVAAGGLGPVEGEVGAGQQVVHLLAVQRIKGDPDTDRDREREARGVDRLVAHGQQLLGQADGTARIGEVGDHERELVAADSGRRVRGAEHAPDPGRDLAQHGVAGRVAVRVVDLLEAVDVEGHHRHEPAIAPGADQRVVQPVEQEQPVR
jgi:hypothetical protein